MAGYEVNWNTRLLVKNLWICSRLWSVYALPRSTTLPVVLKLATKILILGCVDWGIQYHVSLAPKLHVKFVRIDVNVRHLTNFVPIW